MARTPKVAAKISGVDNQDRSWMTQHHINQGKLRNVKPKAGKSYGVGEYVAIGAAAGLTGLVGAATVSALNEGFRGGTGKLGPKGR